MTRQVYGIGYSKRKLSDVARIARSLDAVVFDIRWRAGSRNPSWNKSTLQRTLGERYVRARELGNVNYKGTVRERVREITVSRVSPGGPGILQGSALSNESFLLL